MGFHVLALDVDTLFEKFEAGRGFTVLRRTAPTVCVRPRLRIPRSILSYSERRSAKRRVHQASEGQ